MVPWGHLADRRRLEAKCIFRKGLWLVALVALLIKFEKLGVIFIFLSFSKFVVFLSLLGGFPSGFLGDGFFFPLLLCGRVSLGLPYRFCLSADCAAVLCALWLIFNFSCRTAGAFEQRMHLCIVPTACALIVKGVWCMLRALLKHAVHDTCAVVFHNLKL